MGMDGQRHTWAALLPVDRNDTHHTAGWVSPRTGLKNK
jgi:hypothetical protein